VTVFDEAVDAIARFALHHRESIPDERDSDINGRTASVLIVWCRYAQRRME